MERRGMSLEVEGGGLRAKLKLPGRLFLTTVCMCFGATAAPPHLTSRCRVTPESVSADTGARQCTHTPPTIARICASVT